MWPYFSKKKNNVVGFSEVGALIAKTVEEEIKVVSQKPKWEIQFIEHYSALLRAVLYACLWLIAHLHFWWLHSKELWPKMNSWYSAFLFAVSVCSQINCTYISQGFERRNISIQKLDSVIQAGKCPRNKWDFLWLCHKREFRMSTRFQDSITTSPLYPQWAYPAHFASWVIRLHS